MERDVEDYEKQILKIQKEEEGQFIKAKMENATVIIVNENKVQAI